VGLMLLPSVLVMLSVAPLAGEESVRSRSIGVEAIFGALGNAQAGRPKGQRSESMPDRVVKDASYTVSFADRGRAGQPRRVEV
jgi:hypothetical protein